MEGLKMAVFALRSFIFTMKYGGCSGRREKHTHNVTCIMCLTDLTYSRAYCQVEGLQRLLWVYQHAHEGFRSFTSECRDESGPGVQGILTISSSVQIHPRAMHLQLEKERVLFTGQLQGVLLQEQCEHLQRYRVRGKLVSRSLTFARGMQVIFFQQRYPRK